MGGSPQQLDIDASGLLKELEGLVGDEESVETLELWGEKINMSLTAAGKLRNVLVPVLEERQSVDTFQDGLKRMCEEVGCFGSGENTGSSKVKDLEARILELEAKNVRRYIILIREGKSSQFFSKGLSRC
jgi:hypothetical protein